METAIHVGAVVEAESVALIGGAIVEILQVCANHRIPEAVMLRALDTLGRHSETSGVNINGCNISDARGDAVKN